MGKRYVTRDDEQTFAPPYVQGGCALHGFALPADPARLQAIVDRHLAEPSGGRVRPRVASDHVLLYFCDFARSHSSNPLDAQRGWLGERECGIWLPIHRPEARGLGFFVHTMIVDSGPAMCSGREVLGFPKQIGLIHVAREPACATLLAVDTLAWGNGPADPGRWRPLVEFERVDRVAGRPVDGVRSLLAMLGRRSFHGEVEFVNLKQFRDAADPTLACYQAIVGARARLLCVQRLARTAPYAYRVSQSLIDGLGLPASGHTRGLFCEFDFELGLGVTQ
jgi:hypothetical protein